MNQILTFFWNTGRGRITFMGKWDQRKPQLRSRSREAYGVGVGVLFCFSWGVNVGEKKRKEVQEPGW